LRGRRADPAPGLVRQLLNSWTDLLLVLQGLRGELAELRKQSDSLWDGTKGTRLGGYIGE